MKTTLIRQINSDRNSHQDTSDEKAFNPLVKDCWLKLVIHTHVLQRICKICRGGDTGDLVEKKESPKGERAVKPVISFPSKNGY